MREFRFVFIEKGLKLLTEEMKASNPKRLRQAWEMAPLSGDSKTLPEPGGFRKGCNYTANRFHSWVVNMDLKKQQDACGAHWKHEHKALQVYPLSG